MKKKKESKVITENPFRRTMTDPQGSYTGVGTDIQEEPVQDVDDL